ncbi:MAG: hypothetical protein ABFS17_11065, partial [Chloroflexota bacterium]
PAEFLKRLAGMCRYAIARQDGELNLARLAAALVQTEGAVRLGISWLQARGHISVVEEGITALIVSEDQSSDRGFVDPETTLRNLSYLLSEASAFRRFVRTSTPETFDALFSLK